MKILCLFLLLSMAAARAYEIRLSVKVIQNYATGDRPGLDCNEFNPCSNLATQANFQMEVDRANRILAVRGVSLQLVEYVDIRPVPPPNKSGDYWFTLPARDNRAVVEAAALANKTVWRWSDTAVNIFVNNTTSGQCSIPPTGGTILLGRAVGTGTVLHEVGHLMGLQHTHGGDDSDCSGHTPPLSRFLSDGDGLAETAPDRLCFDRDQLSRALFNERLFDSLTPAEQDRVNSSWLNVMSYHQEDRLLSGQFDIFCDTASILRRSVCSGRSIFVDGGNTCPNGLPPNYDSYRWWVEQSPLPEAPLGTSKPLSVTVDPPSPPRPPGWIGDWPPLLELGKPSNYPDGWPWPPVDMPAVTFCIGGPRYGYAQAFQQAADGDTIHLRSGLYEGMGRITRRMKITSWRGTATLR